VPRHRDFDVRADAARRPGSSRTWRHPGASLRHRADDARTPDCASASPGPIRGGTHECSASVRAVVVLVPAPTPPPRRRGYASPSSREPRLGRRLAREGAGPRRLTRSFVARQEPRRRDHDREDRRGAGECASATAGQRPRRRRSQPPRGNTSASSARARATPTSTTLRRWWHLKSEMRLATSDGSCRPSFGRYFLGISRRFSRTQKKCQGNYTSDYL